MIKPNTLFSSQTKLLVLLLTFMVTTLSMTNRRVSAVNKSICVINRSVITHKSRVIADKLYELVLDNFEQSNQLQQLLRKKDNDHEKLVLQFYVNSNGEMVLAAYVGHRKRKQFEQKPQILRVRQNSTTVIDLSRNIFLSDQEISTKKNGNELTLDHLRDIINKPGYEYIIFQPIQEGDHIKFHLYHNSDKAALSPSDSDLFMSTNPSPPKDAN